MVFVQSGTIASSRDVANSVRGQRNSPYAAHSCCFEAEGKRWLMRNNDQRRCARVNCTQLNTDSMPGNFLQINDVYFDIQITGAPVHTLEFLVLHVSIVNVQPLLGVPMIPLLPFWFFNRVECMSNGAYTDDTIYPLQWYLDYIGSVKLAQKTVMAPVVGMDTVGFPSTSAARTTWTTYDENTVAIAPQDTRQFYIPFNWNFLVQSNAWLKSKSQNPKFRFYGAVDPVTSDSNVPPDPVPTNPLLLNGAEFIVGGIIFQSDICEKINKYYSGANTLSRVVLHERQIFDLSSFNPGVESSDQSLTGFNGEFSAIWIIVSRAEAAREQLYCSNRTYTAATQGWLPISRVSLKDSSGNPVMFLNMGSELLRNVFPARQFPELAIGAYKELYYFPFSMSGYEEMQDGVARGGIYFDAKFQLQLTAGNYTPGATVAFKNTVLAKRIGLLLLTPQGEFKITKL